MGAPFLRLYHVGPKHLLLMGAQAAGLCCTLVTAGGFVNARGGRRSRL